MSSVRLCGVNGCSHLPNHQGPHEHDADEWPASEHALYMPPWSDHFAGAGAVEYGPRTASAYQRRLLDYDQEGRGNIGSPSLWDRELAGNQVRMATSSVERKDADVFERRIGVLASSMPRRELEAAAMFWRDRMSVGRIAAVMGVARPTVRTWISRTRERLVVAREQLQA
jgi:hypothetical protein